MSRQSDEIPEPKSSFQAAAEANNVSAKSNAKSQYRKEMEEIVGGKRPYMNPGKMETEHKRIKERAIDLFSRRRKMGGAELSNSHKEELIAEIEEWYDSLRKHNASKKISSATGTPAVLFAVMVMAYLLSGIARTIGLQSLVNLLNLVLVLFLLMLVAWIYVRYSGEFREIGGYIDQLVDFLWEHAWSQIYAKAAALMAQQAAKQETRKMKQN